MKKDNKLIKFTLFVLLITIVAIILVSGTFAKYTSEVSGTDTATVAKWQIKVNGTDITVENPSVTFNLFDTINDTGNTAAETDVVTGKIAPGTAGKFDLKIDNLSEVTAKYSIAFELTNTGSIPVEFSTDGTTWKTALDPIESTEAEYLTAESGTKTITVQWRWAYEGATSTNYTTTQTDVTDTALGTAAKTTPAEVKVKTTLTATQVD